jgi:hypothetical protein
MAILHDEPLTIEFEQTGDFREDWKLEDEAFDRAIEEAKKSPGIVGRFLRWQRGDGYAWYKVVSEKPLTLQWVDYGDRWQVEYALIKGLDVEDVKEHLRRMDGLDALFSKEEKGA